MATSQSKRRWMRFSLRALLVFVLVLSVPLGWFAWKMDRARRQREAVEAILKVGGFITYDYQIDERGIWKHGAEPTTPAWLRKSLGDDFFCDVRCVGLGLPQVTDAELEHLQGLTSLKSLHLSQTQISDAGLEHLKGLTNLETLVYSHTQVTDARLEHLRGLTKLKILDLDDTRVTDAGLEHLKGLTNLKELWLLNTQVTDEGVKKLQQALPNCEIHHN